MKPASFIIVLSCMLFVNAYSQKQKGVVAGLSFGPSFAIGKYGSKAAEDNNAGWAQTGAAASVWGTCFFNTSFGIALAGRYQDNKMSEATFKKYLLQLSRANINLQTGHWTVVTAMAGPVLRVPLSGSGKAVFTARATAGACKTYVPSFRYSALIIGNPPNGVTGSESVYASEQKLPVAFCFEVHPQLSFLLIKPVSLTVSASYFSTASQTYIPGHGSSGYIIYGNNTPNGPVVINSTKAHTSLSSLAAEIGIEVRLSK